MVRQRRSGGDDRFGPALLALGLSAMMWIGVEAGMLDWAARALVAPLTPRLRAWLETLHSEMEYVGESQ